MFGLASCKTFDMVSSYPCASEMLSLWSVQIVGSVNGLLCLFNFNVADGPIYLMNPPIGKYKVINSSAIAHQTNRIDPRVVLGFGYSKESDDYRIVRFFEDEVVDQLAGFCSL